MNERLSVEDGFSDDLIESVARDIAHSNSRSNTAENQNSATRDVRKSAENLLSAERTFEEAVAEQQRSDGNHKGSWDPNGAWGHEGGRVYTTAINALTLQVYYRYSRVVR